MEMSDSDDMIQCQIINVIRPDYLVVCQPESKERDRKIKEIEKKLTNEWQHVKSTTHSRHLPGIGSHVAVSPEACNAKTCRRGLIIGISALLDKYNYDVILYDYGLPSKVTIGDMFEVMDGTADVPARCKIVQVPGIIPAKISTDIALEKPYEEKIVEGTQWSEAALVDAKRWVAENQNSTVLATCREVSTLIVFGDFHARNEKRQLLHKTYSDVLLDKKHAVRNNEKYQQDISNVIDEDEVGDWKTQTLRSAGLLSPPKAQQQQASSSSSTKTYGDWNYDFDDATTKTVKEISESLNTNLKVTEKTVQSQIKSSELPKKVESTKVVGTNSEAPTKQVNIKSSSSSKNSTTFVQPSTNRSSPLTTTNSTTSTATTTKEEKPKVDKKDKKDLFAPVDVEDTPSVYAAIANRRKVNLNPDHINHNLPQSNKTAKDNSSFDYAPIKETCAEGKSVKSVPSQNQPKPASIQLYTVKTPQILTSSRTSPTLKSDDKEYPKTEQALRSKSNPTYSELCQKNKESSLVFNTSSEQNINQDSNRNKIDGQKAQGSDSFKPMSTSTAANSILQQQAAKFNPIKIGDKPHSHSRSTTDLTTTLSKELPKGGKIRRQRSPESVSKYLKSRESLDKVVSSSSEFSITEASADEGDIMESEDKSKKPSSSSSSTLVEGGKSRGNSSNSDGDRKSTPDSSKIQTTRSILFGRDKQAVVQNILNKPETVTTSITPATTSASATTTANAKAECVKPEPTQSLPRHTKVIYDCQMSQPLKESTDSDFRKMLRGRIFVHGFGSPPAPAYASINDFPLYEAVKTVLGTLFQKSHGKSNCLLNTVMPNVMRGRNCFIVDRKDNGKSLSYMIPIVAKMILEAKNEKSTRGNAVFLTAALSTGDKLMSHFDHLCQRYNQNSAERMTCIFISECNTAAKKEFNKGWDILVVTPECLYQIMEKHEYDFKFDRLKYFVVDDSDILLATKMDVVKNIFEILGNSLKQLGPRNTPLQNIFCGTYWSPQLENAYLKLVPDPVAFLNEAQSVAFANVKPVVYFTKTEDEKTSHVLVRLQETIKKYYKVMIYCQDDKTVEALKAYIFDNLKIVAQTLSRATGNISSSVIGAVLEQWKQGSEASPEIIICTDAMTKELLICDATHVIHFEIPQKSTNFGTRFSAMWKWFRGPESTDKVTPVIASIYLTTSDDPKRVSLNYKSLTKMRASIPPQLEQYYLDLKLKLDEELPICQGLLWHGQCDKLDPATCQMRHYFLPTMNVSQFDADISKIGEVEVRIVESKAVCSYVAQLVRFYEVTGGKVILKKHYTNSLRELTKELNDFYACEENQIPVTDFQLKDVVAIQDDDGSFIRASIDEELPGNKVRLFGIDHGEKRVRSINSDSLYVLPDHFRKKTRLAIELIIANMKPMLGERIYRFEHNKAAKRLTDGKILKGRICFSLGNRVWVDQLVEQKRGADDKIRTVKSLRQEFFRKGIAEKNSAHMEVLYKLLEDIGVSCEEYKVLALDNLDPEFERECYQLNDEVQWAHLDVSGDYETIDLYCSYVLPFLIYVNIQKNVQLFDKFLNELNAEIEIKKEKYQLNSIQLKKYYEPSMIVAIKDSKENMWVRGQIEDFYEGSDKNEILYDVFLVDFGDTNREVKASELFPIPLKYVQKFPFQAIALTLDHVKPKNDDNSWDSDRFYEVVPAGSNIEAVIISKTHTTWSSSNHYHAVIFHANDEVGEKLVQEGLAIFEDEGEQLVEEVKSAMLKRINENLNCINNNSDSGSEDEYSSDDMDPIYDADEEFDVNMSESDARDILKKFSGLDIPITNPNVILPSSSSTSDICEPLKTRSLETSPIPTPIAPSELQKRFPGIKIPPTEWYETDDEVLMRVLVPDIKKYDHDLADDKKLYRFWTIEPPNYGFQIPLSKKVEKDVKIFPLGQYTKIIFTKRMKKLEWEKLHSGSKHDLKTVKISYENDSEGEENYSVAPPPRQSFSGNHKTVIRPESSSQSDSDSDVEYSDAIDELMS